MSSKFGHERLNRQEKVWKEPAGCGGGWKESPGLWNFVVTPDYQVRLVLNQQIADRMCRVDLMDAFVAEIRRWRFIVSGYKFMFSWSAKRFADANGLSVPKAKIVFDNVRAEAEERLRMVKQRMRRTGFRTSYERDEAGNLVEVFSLSYAVLPKFLQRDVDVGSNTALEPTPTAP